jgi:uncharacterized protein YndB with AHSA1/START domain
VEETKQERRIEKDIEIAEPKDEVWKALTEPKELVKRFPLGARAATSLPSLRQESNGGRTGKAVCARRSEKKVIVPRAGS